MSEGTWVIDTNVILVAGGMHPAVSGACLASCVERLESIIKNGRIAMDSGYEIAGEYLHRNKPNQGKNPGDIFVKWVLRNMTNAGRCDLVDIRKGDNGEYDSFPRHPDLVNFDPPDKKFVAVAHAHPAKPTILEATDAKWLDWAPVLDGFGIKVDFICLEYVQKIHRNKFGL